MDETHFESYDSLVLLNLLKSQLMRRSFLLALLTAGFALSAAADTNAPAVLSDPNQDLERTCFQTGAPWSGLADLRSDVAICYGIDPTLPERIQTWRDHGYRIQVMTGVSWGKYQNYLYGRFDGINHEDEAQTVSDGRKSSHGGDVYYMCPSTNYGNFLCAGLKPALDARTEAIHLEEPEFWVNSGYSEGFKREWQNFYHEPWRAPNSSVDAQWHASKLKYFLFRRTLQQVFDYVQAYNQTNGTHIRCYVPTHSLLNYASWEIVSPESSLARLKGCDGYIAQVWTGTARTPNIYRGRKKERTFETAFLEYGAMQNLVRGTDRRVWYLNDPIEDNPNHSWSDYQYNWESTLTASLLQPDVWHFEVAPWPERIFGKKYPRSAPRDERKSIPPAYATELQTVMNTLNDMNQKPVSWSCGTTGIGLLISDSLMFERGDPISSDHDLSHIYGLAMPLVMRGIPLAPVQLENVTLPHYLDQFHILLLTYQGMKALTPEVHVELAKWVKHGGVLAVCDDDSDPYNAVKDWWNSDGLQFKTPREHLFKLLGVGPDGDAAKSNETQSEYNIGQGELIWLKKNPAKLAKASDGADEVLALVKHAAQFEHLLWQETNCLLLRRGPYVVAAGLDDSGGTQPQVLSGRFVNLFDSELKVQTSIRLEPGSRFFLRDLNVTNERHPELIASACKALVTKHNDEALTLAVEGADNTQAVVLLQTDKPPGAITLDGQPIETSSYSATDKLLWIRFPNEAHPRELSVQWK
jgi:hypothetical protein